MNPTHPYSAQMLALKMLFALLLSASTGQCLLAQPRSFCEAYTGYGPYGYHTPAVWELIRREYCGRTDDREQFREQAEKYQDGEYFLCPWWVEDLYMTDSVAAANCATVGYVGYVLDVWTGGQQQINEWNSKRCMLDHDLYKDKEFELVVFCGNRGFDYFLESNKAQREFFNRLFNIDYGALSRTHNSRKASGLNLYLPGFTFKNKRDFTQFLYSLRMVVSNYGVITEKGDTIRPYRSHNFNVTLTLPTAAEEEKRYLTTLTDYVNYIELVDYDEYGFPMQKSSASINKDNSHPPLFSQIISQFYMIDDENIHVIDKHQVSDRISQLIQSYYRSENWRAYFVTNVVLSLFMLTLIILYNVYSGFYLLVQRLDFLVTPAFMAYVGETMALLFYMVEAMTRGTQFFDISDSTYYLLLVLPILLFAAYAALRLIFRQKELP